MMLLINADCQFKVLLAIYICYNLSNFSQKKSQIESDHKNRSLGHDNLRAQKEILAHRVFNLRVTKGR